MCSVQRLIRRPDFRAHPIRALWRRMFWRLRWAASSAPWVLDLERNMDMRVPRCGAGALIYYQGSSDPALARLLERLLRPGMVFYDVGAHIGEFTLRGARAVGAQGRVHAFEPLPDLVLTLRENVARNALENVDVHDAALSDRDGDAPFRAESEPALSTLVHTSGNVPGASTGKEIRVRTRTLDAHRAQSGGRVDVVKIDVEGSELRVLAGAASLLQVGPDAPIWIVEYAPHTYARFGFTAADLAALFRRSGYGTWLCEEPPELVPFRPDDAPDRTVNVVAARDEAALRARLRAEPP